LTEANSSATMQTKATFIL